MTAAELFVQRLRERGVDWMATLCGHGLDPLFQAARQAGLRLVDVRNEQTAGYMAECAGRLTRRPGVCAASSGVAHMNALTGVLNAFFDRAPMLEIAGAAAVRTMGLGHFQDCDQVSMASPVTKQARLIASPDRALQMLDEALDAAAEDPPGPVHLTFPMEVQRAEAVDPIRVKPAVKPAVLEDPGPVAAALNAASQPLIVAGSGVFYAGAGEALLHFAEEFSVPVVAPIWDRGSVDRASPVFQGVIGAATGGPRLLADADLIVLAGAQADYRLGLLEPPAVREDARVLRLDRNWAGLASLYRGRDHQAWLLEACRRRDEHRRLVCDRGAEQARQGLHAVHLIDGLRKLLTGETVLLIDGGSIGQWAHQLLCDRYPGHWLTCGRSAVVGWGLAGAMAARLVYPDRPVVLLSGDGAFTFTVAELECAARQKLPFVAFVADDQGWGITRVGHVRQFGEPIASGLGPIAFDRLAESLGARGLAARTPEEILARGEEALASGALTVVHVPIVGGNP